MKVTRKFILPILAAIPLLGLAVSPASGLSGALSGDSIVSVVPAQSIIDEVIWVVGDEAILKSDVESMRMQAAMEGVKWSGDPDCTIPEQIAVQKLFVHQADIDSIEVTENDVAQEVEQQISYWLEMVDGSRERLEEYKHQSIAQMRQEMRQEFRDRQKIQKMKRKLVEDISVTPADVRRYFSNLPADSLPYVPTEVEVQIVTMTPRITPEEINRVKDELRNYTDRINSGETSFSTLARLYSEDPGSARLGGELDYEGRATFDPAFAAVAFNLTDPTKVSKIVESEFGFHIIQLVDKRGDKIKVRHILRKPIVSDSAVNAALERLDTIVTDVRAGLPPLVLRDQLTEKWTFEDAVAFFSDDKDTRNNHGLMANRNEYGQLKSSRFEMQELPAEVARAVETLQVGEISAPFSMINSRGKTVCAVVKLKNRIPGHRATVTEDFQVLKDVVMEKRRAEFLHKWVVDKIKSTYVRLNDQYRDCKFEYEGWLR